MDGSWENQAPRRGVFFLLVDLMFLFFKSLKSQNLSDIELQLSGLGNQSSDNHVIVIGQSLNMLKHMFCDNQVMLTSDSVLLQVLSLNQTHKQAHPAQRAFYDLQIFPILVADSNQVRGPYTGIGNFIFAKGGAANFCMQRFLAGLVYLFLGFQTTVSRVTGNPNT